MLIRSLPRTWETLAACVSEVERLARGYRGDITPRCVEAYCFAEKPRFLMLEVQYDSAGHMALYEWNLDKDLVYLAED